MSPLSVGTSRSTHALETGEAKLWSLLIGVNAYQDDNLPSLRFSASDCQGLGEALTEATQGFPRKESIVHHDFGFRPPTLEAVRESLKQIVAAAKPEDTILLYFSGHGVLDRDSEQVVLCLADTNKDDLHHTGLKLPEVLELLGNSSVHSQMLWLDACHSGDVTLRGAKGEARDSVVLNPTARLEQVLRKRAAQSRGFYALLSCDQKQRSWEFPELKHGLFTYYLMEGLRGEAADSQGIIEADGLYKYVYHQTLQYIEKTNQQLRLINQQKRKRGESDLHPEYPPQTPKRIVEGVGELVLGLKTNNVIPTVNQRRAIVIDGLSDRDTTFALSEILGQAGEFQLEYWPQAGKSWTQVRNAIQKSLRSQPQIILESSRSESRQETTTVLLYLRGKIEQIEDGEAWIVLGDNVKLSRSWLRQELRRTETAQQIVVLDCPGADLNSTFLQDWVEELKLGSVQGQCLIAAASPNRQPEQFAQALLATLLVKEQVGLSVAGWITKLQQQLEDTGIPLHASLSGVQGVIEILPKSSFAPSVTNTPQSSASVKPHHNSQSAHEQKPESNSLPPTATKPRNHLPSDDLQQQYSQLEKLLMELVGPIAPTLLEQFASPTSNPQMWVDNLLPHLPPQQQTQLKQRSSRLQETASQPQTKSSIAIERQTPTIPESFVLQCEKALANYIGPIAAFLVQQVLKSRPQISKTELVEILQAEISDRSQAATFRSSLIP